MFVPWHVNLRQITLLKGCIRPYVYLYHKCFAFCCILMIWLLSRMRRNASRIVYNARKNVNATTYSSTDIWPCFIVSSLWVKALQLIEVFYHFVIFVLVRFRLSSEWLVNVISTLPYCSQKHCNFHWIGFVNSTCRHEKLQKCSFEPLPLGTVPAKFHLLLEVPEPTLSLSMAALSIV